MANEYVSGYTGNIAFSGTASDTVFNPTIDTDFSLESWSIRQVTDEFGVSAKGDAWETTFGTASEWSATVVFLLEDTIAANADAGFDIEIRGGAGTAVKDFDAATTFITTTGETYTGGGIVTSIETDAPQDGPIRVTVGLEGNGKLEYAGGTAP
jgi:hypothetical protein